MAANQPRFVETTVAVAPPQPPCARDPEYVEALQEAVASYFARWCVGDPASQSMTITALVVGDEVHAGLTVRSRSGGVLYETGLSVHRPGHPKPGLNGSRSKTSEPAP